MLRQIIHIDTDKCIGCGMCAEACHEGAIGMVDGKAALMREDYCDGFGDCLPACPAGAITFETREAPAYNEAAVLAAKASKTAEAELPGQLSNFPIQIKLVSPMAPVLQNADLLIAADCTAFAYGNFHARFIRGRTTVIGCPKLDAVNYAEKLTMIFSVNHIRSITLVRMEVPCCGGLVSAVKSAIIASGKDIPLHTVILSNRGEIIKED